MVKKQLIMETAIELFAEKGIESTSIQQITEQCGISKGAFYLSFKSKDELIMSIIDYFMKNFASEIDRAVNDLTVPYEKLYYYFFSTFETMKKNANFTEVFIKEQLHTIDDALLNKMAYYEMLITKTLLDILTELYGKKMSHQQYDLIFIIKGCIASYAQFIMKMQKPLDLHTLCESLVEKIDCIVHHSHKSFITEDMYKQSSCHSELVTKEDILMELQQVSQMVEDEVILDSLSILNEQINLEVPRKALINGMILNLQEDSRCSWLCYLARQYFE